MQTFDVVILGAGETGTRIANQLTRQKLKVALVPLPHGDEDTLQKLDALLATPSRPAPGAPVPDEAVRVLSTAASPRFLDERRLSINDDEVRFNYVVIAAGCAPRRPSDPNVIRPNASLFQSPPVHATVWGAGPVGVATAMKLARLNSAVELISKYERVLPNEDEAISEFVARQLQQAGVRIARSASDEKFGGVHVQCTGLHPNSDDLNLFAARIYVDPTGRIKTDEQMRTSHPRVYAAGAVTGAPFHLSFERFQADLIAENIPALFFMKHRFMPEPFPTLLPFSTPLARLGLTETQARAKFKDAVAVTQTIEDGFVKLIALRRSGAVVGAHAAGPGADGLILFFDLMQRAEIPVRDIGERHHFPSSPICGAAADAVDRWIDAAGR
jgi:dihydrolipoamide dehydrogenase